MSHRRQWVVLQVPAELLYPEGNVARPGRHIPQRHQDRRFAGFPRPAAVLPDVIRAAPRVRQLPRLSGQVVRARAGPAGGVPAGSVPSDRGSRPSPPRGDAPTGPGQSGKPPAKNGRGDGGARDEVLRLARRAPPEGAGLQHQPVQRLTGHQPRLAAAALAASTGMAAIFAAVRLFQYRPVGRRCGSHAMTSSGVTIRSTLKSCSVSGMCSSITWSGWTVVTITVLGPIRPASWSSATSMSE